MGEHCERHQGGTDKQDDRATDQGQTGAGENQDEEFQTRDGGNDEESRESANTFSEAEPGIEIDRDCNNFIFFIVVVGCGGWSPKQI